MDNCSLLLPPFRVPAGLTDYLGKDVTADDGALIVTDAASDAVRTLTEQLFDEVNGTRLRSTARAPTPSSFPSSR